MTLQAVESSVQISPTVAPARRLTFIAGSNAPLEDASTLRAFKVGSISLISLLSL